MNDFRNLYRRYVLQLLIILIILASALFWNLSIFCVNFILLLYIRILFCTFCERIVTSLRKTLPSPVFSAGDQHQFSILYLCSSHCCVFLLCAYSLHILYLTSYFANEPFPLQCLLYVVSDLSLLNSPFCNTVCDNINLLETYLHLYHILH